MRVLLLVMLPGLVLAGCDKLFKLPHIDEQTPPIDAAADVRDGRPDAPDARPDSIMQTHSNCPAGFGNPYENSKYLFVATTKTWFAAFMHCQGLDDPTSTKRVHLPVLTSDFERSQYIYVTVVGSFSAYWLGFSDTRVEGAYQWVSSEQTGYVPFWGPSEPSTAPADDCVRVEYSNNDLDSMPCTTPSSFVCECDDYSLDPTHYDLM